MKTAERLAEIRGFAEGAATHLAGLDPERVNHGFLLTREVVFYGKGVDMVIAERVKLRTEGQKAGVLTGKEFGVKRIELRADFIGVRIGLVEIEVGWQDPRAKKTVIYCGAGVDVNRIRPDGVSLPRLNDPDHALNRLALRVLSNIRLQT